MSSSAFRKPYHNPILPGFHPDPSICRAGEDYFLVNSSFAYFPGVPLFHSRDLVHWRQIGYCLNRTSQLAFGRSGVSGGIFAPTIRYQQGIFYMVTTNVTHGGNFYVTTSDPFGDWSEPTWLAQGGIDPSLLFHEGHIYLTSTGILDQPDQKMKTQGILQSEVDITRGALLSQPRMIWSGTGGAFPEGPHLYQIGAYFYLMIAEGGTEYGHTEVIARSASPWGPWESCPHNPILTHRSYQSPIQALGHGDLVQAQDGSWWMVCLGIRPNFAQAHHLGRETFLAPVEWDSDGWPHVGTNGRIELKMESPRLTRVEWNPPAERDDFNTQTLGLKWNFLGAPQPESWSLTRRPGALSLKGNAACLDDGLGVVFLGCRQEHFNCEVAASVDFCPTMEGEEAGLTVWKDARHHYDVFVSVESGIRYISVRKRIGSLSARVARREIIGGPLTVLVGANRLFYTFVLLTDLGEAVSLGTGETRYLSTEVAGGFTGVFFGLYASGNGRASNTPVFFDWFDYRSLDNPEILSIESPLSKLLSDQTTQAVLNRHLPELVANPPAEWGVNLSLLDLAAMEPEEISPEKIHSIDLELRAARIDGR